METKERDLMAAPKPSKQIGFNREVKRLAKSHDQKIHYTQDGFSWPNSQRYYWPQVIQSSQAPQPYPGLYHKRSPYTYSNAIEDPVLTIPEKGKDTPSRKNLASEIVGHYGDRSCRREEAGTSYRTYTHDPSRSSAANGDEATSDDRDDTNQGLSAIKKLRLNLTNADDYSAAEMLDATLNLATIYSSAGAAPSTTKISDDSELRKQRRRQMNRESAKRSRLRKQQEREKLRARLEALKADSSALRKELESLSEECRLIHDENKQIKEELIRISGPGIFSDFKDSWPELCDHENDPMQK